MREKSQQTGRSLLETLAVLVIIAILTIAALLGYSFILRKYQDKQTVKQVAEVGVRYGLNRVKPRNDGKVLMKDIYPEAEREDAVTMITANHGRVWVSVEQTDSYQVEVNNVTDNSCREILASAAYDALLYDIGAGKKIAIGSEYLSGKKLDGNEQKRLSKMAGKTKEQIIEEVCNEQRTGTHFMALIWGGNCPKSTASYLHSDGKCWFCPEGTYEDKYHNCCADLENRPCGVCGCPDETPHCDKDGENATNTCVECYEDAHCPGKACDLKTHKCVPCIPYDTSGVDHSRGCEDEKTLGKPWCSNGHICEECLESYDSERIFSYNCSSDKPTCNKDDGEPNWRCEVSWPCEKVLLTDTCKDGVSGSIGLYGKCSNECKCADGLTCVDEENGSCPKCQCIVPNQEDRTVGQRCSDVCPCAGNLTCADGTCSCLEDDHDCNADEDCCSGKCYEGKCYKSNACKKQEYDDECSTDSTDYENCCADGTVCATIGENKLCCPTKEGEPSNGSEGAYCESNECCQSGLTCNTETNKCVSTEKCGGTLLDRWASCSATGLENCCNSDDELNCTGGYCCKAYDGECMKEGAVSKCCSASYPNCVTSEGEDGFGTCCKNAGDVGDVCGEDESPNDCCKSGNCVFKDEVGKCCPAEADLPNVGETCSEHCGCKEGEGTCVDGKCTRSACPTDGSCTNDNAEDCCESKKCTSTGQCCPLPNELPTLNNECSQDCGCKEGEGTCMLDEATNTYKCMATCPEEDRTQEGASCSDECPCEAYGENAIPMQCGPDHKCHLCPEGQYWFKPQSPATVPGACCPTEGGLANGQTCTTDSCCQSGNCAKADENDGQGICCQSAYNLMLKRGTTLENGGGKCCEKVDNMGDSCTNGSAACCTEGHCRRVFIKMSAKTTKNFPCKKYGKSFKCTDSCGGKARCHMCVEYDIDHPLVTQSAWKNEGWDKDIPTRCCEGNGDLGSPCSEKCPCKGTAFSYYVDKKLQKKTISYDEYDDDGCTCRRTPELYCRPDGEDGRGTCVQNPKIDDSGAVDRSALKISCAYSYDFKHKSKNECYMCPANTVFREDNNNVACCPLGALNASASGCRRYSKNTYKSNHSGDEMQEGEYIDEATGLRAKCPVGFFCVNGQKKPCEAGTYANNTGSVSCRFCGKGNYCPEGSTQATKCPIGNYCPNVGTPEPIPCAPGKYTAKNGQSSKNACIDCPKGYYCPGGSAAIPCDGRTLPGACPRKGMEKPEGGSGESGQATYLSAGKLKICEKGYYCDGTTRFACRAGTYADKTGSTECKPAPDGVSITGAACTGSSDTKLWKPCAAGYYAEGSGNVSCKKCPSGTYQDQKGQGSCIKCPEGQMSKEGATKASDCKSCTELAQKTETQTECCSDSNKVKVTNEATGKDYCCPAGQRYCKGKKNGTFACNASTACALTQEQAEEQDKHCTEKQYITTVTKNKKKQLVCAACPAGYACDGSSAEKCKPGTYAAAGAGVCTPCPIGKYQGGAGASECVVPTGNGYVDEEGAQDFKRCVGDGLVPNKARTGCKTCPEGTRPDKEHTACSVKVCKAGFMFVDETCRKCLPNYYCPNGYQERSCPEGSFSLAGATKCTPCKSGQYWSAIKGECVKCKAGNMCTKGLQTKCPEGTISAAGASQCYSCDEGKYFTSNSCKTCDAGTASSGGTVTKCTACPVGKYQPQKGQKSCEFCPAGKWSTKAGSTSCGNCPAGYLCEEGQKQACPAGQWSKAGGTECTACSAGYTCKNGKREACAVGKWTEAGGTTCTNCPKGYFCKDGKKVSCPKCPAGSKTKKT